MKKFKPTKLVKIKRGYHGGTNAEYQYGSQIILIGTRVYDSPVAYVKPKINAGDEIFRGQRFENMRTFLKRLRLHLERIERELLKAN